MSSGEQSSSSIPENPQSDPSDDSFDPGLTQLRDQVKKVMIPLLIKTFELKLAAQQLKSPPSRLQKQIGEPPEKIRKQLDKLGDNLKQLQLWCHSCQNQISKALNEIDEDPDRPMRHTTSSESKEQAQKSFWEAIFSKAVQSKSQDSAEGENPKGNLCQTAKVSDDKSNHGWLSKWFFRQQKPQ